MDNRILKVQATIWQEKHWINRSALLKGGAAVRDMNSAIKVVLLSLDRNRESSCLNPSLEPDLMGVTLPLVSRARFICVGAAVQSPCVTSVVDIRKAINISQ